MKQYVGLIPAHATAIYWNPKADKHVYRTVTAWAMDAQGDCVGLMVSPERDYGGLIQATKYPDFEFVCYAPDGKDLNAFCNDLNAEKKKAPVSK
jgi:hypothetical protein